MSEKDMCNCLCWSAVSLRWYRVSRIRLHWLIKLRQVIKGCIFPLTHRHLFTDLSLGKMSASETALSANMNNLEVKSTSAFNTPISGTPIPTTTLSSETLALLTEEATKALHTEKSFCEKHGI